MLDFSSFHVSRSCISESTWKVPPQNFRADVLQRHQRSSLLNHEKILVLPHLRMLLGNKESCYAPVTVWSFHLFKKTCVISIVNHRMVFVQRQNKDFGKKAHIWLILVIEKPYKCRTTCESHLYTQVFHQLLTFPPFSSKDTLNWFTDR